MDAERDAFYEEQERMEDREGSTLWRRSASETDGVVEPAQSFDVEYDDSERTISASENEGLPKQIENGNYVPSKSFLESIEDPWKFKKATPRRSIQKPSVPSFSSLQQPRLQDKAHSLVSRSFRSAPLKPMESFQSNPISKTKTNKRSNTMSKSKPNEGSNAMLYPIRAPEDIFSNVDDSIIPLHILLHLL